MVTKTTVLVTGKLIQTMWVQQSSCAITSLSAVSYQDYLGSVILYRINKEQILTCAASPARVKHVIRITACARNVDNQSM